MLSIPLPVALLVIGTLLLTTVVAGTLTSRFGLPALIGFLGLGMLAGVDGPGRISFDDYELTQGVGVACLIFILFSGGMDTSWHAVRKMVRPALLLATFGVLISAVITGFAAVMLLDFSWFQGFLLGQVVMFLMLGLLVAPSNLVDVIVPGLGITFVLMLVARPVSVFICLAPFRTLDWRAKLFVSWAGLRGAVPIVLATFPMVAGVTGAFTIFNIVFFVVLLSSVIQGPSIKFVARRLGIGATPETVPIASARQP